MQIAFAERKSDVLAGHGSLPCLRGVPCVNVTRGCAYQCSYCIAHRNRAFDRGRRVVVYANLAEKLRAELDERRHRPSVVYFSPSSDAFQPLRPVLRNKMMEAGKAFVGYQESVKNNLPSKQKHWRPDAAAYYHFVDCALGSVEYTSFETSGDVLAHDRVIKALDSLCTADRESFLARVELECSRFLLTSTPPVADEKFEKAVRHWVKQDGDFGSAVPIDECLQSAPALSKAAMARHLATLARDYWQARAALPE